MNNLDPLMTSARTGDSSKDQWRTPKWLFNLLDSEFHFNLDVCADVENTLCEYYYDKEMDGLKQKWYGACWCNPPYSQAKLWVEKGYNEAKEGHCEVSVILLAARTDTRYWWDYIRHGEVRFLKGRLKFEGGLHSAPFPSAVVVFWHGRFMKAETVYWEIEK